MTAVQSLNLLLSRFPSRRESYLVLSVCILPIHLWTTVVMLYNIPSLVLKANVWQILGVTAYVFVIALLECLSLFGVIVLLSFLLPGRIFRERFVSLGTALAIIFPGIAFLFNTQLVVNRAWILIPLGFVILAVLIYLVRRPLEQVGSSALAERMTILSGLYLLLDMACAAYLIVHLLFL
jgi:hypothetical protein